MLNNDDEKQRLNCTIYCKPGENSIINTENFDISTTEIEGIGKALEDEVILYKSQSKFDCVIFLVKPGENINNDSMRFLKKCREINNFTYIFFIMNQWDTVVNENERKAIKEKFFKQVEKNFPESIKNNLVHFISAKTELEAIENQKEVSKEYKELQNRLKNFIFNDRFISKTSPYIKFLENKSNDIINFLSETRKINDLKIKILERIKTEKWKRDNINNEIKGTSLNILIKNEKIKNYLCNNTNDDTFILKYIENRLEDFNDINEKINKMLSEKLSEFFYEENLSKILNKDNHGNFNSSFDVYICTTKKLINESFIDNFSDLNSSIKKDIENKTIEWLGKEAYNNNIINPIEKAHDIIEIEKFNLKLNTDSNFFERINLWCTNILFTFQEIFNIINKKSKSDKINSKIFNYINDSRKDNEIDKKIIKFYTESTINSIHIFFKNEFFLKFSDMAFQNLCKIIILNELYNYLNPNASSKKLCYNKNFNYDKKIYGLIEKLNNSNFLTFYKELKKRDFLKINFDDEIKILKTCNKDLSFNIDDIENIREEIENIREEKKRKYSIF